MRNYHINRGSDDLQQNAENKLPSEAKDLEILHPEALRQKYHELDSRHRELAVQNAELRATLKDLTERMAQEEDARSRLADHLHQAEKMEAIGTLAGGIAHDFNNTLAIILRFTEVALGQLSTASPVDHSLQEILTAANRAKDLVQQILVFSRQNSPERHLFRLHDLVNETLTLLRGSIPSTITIRTHVNTPSDTVLANPTQLQQVIMNLCSNAERAMRSAGGELELVLDLVDVTPEVAAQHPELQPGPHVRLAVRDNGPGMSSATLERIFDPFFTTKQGGEGTGMGLAVVHGIVASHNGTIHVTSVLNEGATFEIYLPEQPDIVAEAPVADDAPPPPGQGHILFVDDEEGLAIATRILLTDLGYEVSVCTNGVEARDAFRAAPSTFDLVIADQTMPQMTGKELADALRTIRPDIPIILCTGYSHIIDAAQAEDQGINAFLMKPVDIYDLADTIHQVLRQARMKDA